MTRGQAAAARLWAGAEAAARHTSQALTAWVAAGRRHDLDGWTAALGCWLRTALLAGAAGLLWQAVDRWTWLMWPTVAAAAAAAWRAGDPHRAPADTPTEDPAETPAAPVDAATLAAAVRTLAAGGQGAHIAALAAHLTKTTGQPVTPAAVRASCKAAGIPVTPSVRQPGRRVSTGVAVTDLPQPLPNPSPDPAEAVVVAGQDTTTGGTTATATPAEPQVEEHGGGALRIVKDPAEMRHYRVGAGPAAGG
ncbi:hypothetical protein LG634_24705 [Streptomyces bambusae]|uniref:hypothetical protein n=1 Tax=Streptomyces bambusae TaxID=1550616 RepID=UPI001CFD5DBC|nr:hypothetical protein [Streptomyces bambusae]MCB5168015.1 hypothetical protein [Streptomyces bambusae]